MNKKQPRAAGRIMPDSIISICEEKIPSAGEDSYFYKTEREMALVSVFDGCGGAGGREYAALSGKTGAYIASRAVSGAVCNWAKSLESVSNLEEKSLRETLAMSITSALDTCKARCGSSGNVRMKGSMSKEFPTTAAIALCTGKENSVKTTLFWAGDSRAYILNAEGLSQLTTDDLDGIDAFENISADGVLTNVISASGEYTLHSRELSLPIPCILFCATDGCFGYIQTPMHFEYLLLECLRASSSLSEWEKLLNRSFSEVSGDDYSFVAVLYGYGSFEHLKRSFYAREEYMYHTYIQALQSANDETASTLWEQYSSGYYKYLFDFSR